MGKRRLAWWTVAACTALVVASAVLLMFFREPDVAEVAARIVPGMTEAEVEGVLRRPADYDYYGVIGRIEGGPQTSAVRFWLGDKQTLTVAFDGEGVVLNSWLADSKGWDRSWKRQSWWEKYLQLRK